MKIISALKIFFISLFLIASTKANEINDFQIEGLSLGDSLYNHLSKKEISKNQEFIYSNDKNFSNEVEGYRQFINVDSFIDFLF